MRARNLKPGLFTNELLAVADPLHSLLFAGLWCMADREGRLEDRPAKIHIHLNPGRGFERTEQTLAWLAENGFITRYCIGQVRYIQVNEFLKHQNPHQKEAPSKIPKPEASTGLAPGSTAMDAASTRLIPSSLIPDSGSLIPDSLQPEVSTGLESESEIRTRIDRIKSIYPKPARPDWITGEKLIRNLVRDGETFDNIEAGVRRYRAHCDATARAPQNPGIFFAAVDRPWTHDWAIPAQRPKVGAAAQPNHDAAWAEAKSRAKAIGFREPLDGESAAGYMTQVKLAEDRVPRLGPKIATIAGQLRK